MAQRGGSVISTIKVGAFRSPLILRGSADVGLFLHPLNLEVHRDLMKPDGRLYVNGEPGEGFAAIAASAMAREMGAPVLANLILLGHALRRGGLFCGRPTIETAIRSLSNPKFVASNLAGLQQGFDA